VHLELGSVQRPRLRGAARRWTIKRRPYPCGRCFDGWLVDARGIPRKWARCPCAKQYDLAMARVTIANGAAAVAKAAGGRNIDDGNMQELRRFYSVDDDYRRKAHAARRQSADVVSRGTGADASSRSGGKGSCDRSEAKSLRDVPERG
jgi:hypothetical protein